MTRRPRAAELGTLPDIAIRVGSKTPAQPHSLPTHRAWMSSSIAHVGRSIPRVFFALLHEAWPGILRSKGLFWIATRNDMAGSLSQVGGTCRHGPAGFWWAAQPADEWPDDEAFKAEIAHDWLASPDAHGRETVGDRRQELVMIGIDIDRDAWQHKFDACLLSDAEWLLKTDGSALFEDPFPQWDEDHEHGEDH